MLWSLSVEITVSSPWHAHDIFEFALCRDHGGRLLTEGGEIALQPARTILVPPNTPHRFLFDGDDVGRLKIICFPPKDLPGVLSPSQIHALDTLRGGGVSVADHPGQERWLGPLSDLIADGLGIDDAPGPHLHWSTVGLLLALHARHRQEPAGHGTARHRARIQEVVAWVETHLAEDLTLEQVTSRFGLSRTLFTREFRHYTGKSFVEYCNARRVQKAAMALVTRPDSVTEVALDSGYSNLSHFHRQFKSHFGLTPAAFRRKVIEDGGL